MTKRFIRRKGILYRKRRDRWGVSHLYYVNFDKLSQYKRGKQLALYVNDDGVLCNYKDEALPDWVQAHYNSHVEEEVERLLLGG